MKEHNSIDAQRPGGFLDFLPAEYIAREEMLKKIEKTFMSFGFDAIETPMVEFRKTLSGEEGETGKQIFSITSSDSKGEDLALRFDHTIPFARLLAQNPYDAVAGKGIRLPWRRMVVGPNFRGERPQKGRYRQFYQFDADIAGTDSMIADTEIIALMCTTLKNLGIERFVIRINNRKILNGLATLAGITDRGDVSADDMTKELMRILDKIDKLGVDVVVQLLQKEPESVGDAAPCIGADAIEKIRAFLSISGSNVEKLAQCKILFDGIDVAQEGIAELHEILNLVESFDIADDMICVDFSIARGLDYYTGTVMETNLLDALEFGSIFSGGRYDGLVKRFTGQDLPAVGTSIGVDRLFSALQSLGILTMDKKTRAQVMVLRILPDEDALYMSIAQKVRSTGFNVEVSLLRDTTFKQQFNYALTRGVKYVIICGEDEIKKNIVQVKNLMTRNQCEVNIDDLSEYFSTLES